MCIYIYIIHIYLCNYIYMSWITILFLMYVIYICSFGVYIYIHIHTHTLWWACLFFFVVLLWPNNSPSNQRTLVMGNRQRSVFTISISSMGEADGHCWSSGCQLVGGFSPPLWIIWLNWDDHRKPILMGKFQIDGNQTTNQVNLGTRFPRLTLANMWAHFDQYEQLKSLVLFFFSRLCGCIPTINEKHKEL